MTNNEGARYPRARMIRTAAIVVGSVALGCLAACPTVDLGEDPSNPGVCRPDPAYFRNEVWPKFIKVPSDPMSCAGAAGCHREADGRSGLRFDSSSTPDLDRNYRVAIRFLNCGTPSASTLLTRPLAGEDSHGGGDIFTMTDPQVAVFEGWF